LTLHHSAEVPPCHQTVLRNHVVQSVGLEVVQMLEVGCV
jgi:hypothetical protein